MDMKNEPPKNGTKVYDQYCVKANCVGKFIEVSFSEVLPLRHKVRLRIYSGCLKRKNFMIYRKFKVEYVYDKDKLIAMNLIFRNDKIAVHRYANENLYKQNESKVFHKMTNYNLT